MSIVKPFRALRPLPERAAEVASVPYDVVNTEEARALAGENQFSFLRVSRPEIEMPEGTNLYSDEVYARAATNFDRLLSGAPLILEDEPSFYFYRLRMGGREQTGLVACCSIDEYDQNLIRKHEITRKDKEDDRTRHILTLRAQTGPVFLIHQPSSTLQELSKALTLGTPLFHFEAPDQVTHTVWRVPIPMNQALISAFAELKSLYIADGHHRAKSASRAREVLRDQNAQHQGHEEYNFFQCVIFPADQLRILPYNRVVKDLNLRTSEEFLSEVKRGFEVSENADPSPNQRGAISMYLNRRWYGLRVKSELSHRPKIIDRLDVSLLQDLLLAPTLGIQDLRTDKRIEFIGGIRGPQELEKLVNQDQAAVAFSLYPASIEELIEVSDANEIMPPKSTWFEPKLRDGLLSHII
ncbi:MAG TPA: DUF1015 family protein [Blastocatellia bacterium]|nr:DUF1015 family protein [Blastocatellia bacterium]